jgi:hypothetical protein
VAYPEKDACSGSPCAPASAKAPGQGVVVDVAMGTQGVVLDKNPLAHGVVVSVDSYGM